jgi:gluconate 5-dehydrogenase
MTFNLFDLSGRRALITGSSRGIGLSMAEGLGRAGASVILNARTVPLLDEAVAGLRASGIDAVSAVFDVTDQPQVVAAIDKIERDAGPIDILYNNAGIQRRGPLEEFPVDCWHEIIRRKRGKIVNTCSMTSELGRYSIAPYAATKGAVKMLTKGMCTDWARYNIQVNGIGPGYFETPLNQALMDNPEFDAWLKKRTPAGRWGKLEELQGAAIFLASAASDFVNGQILYVDGGILATL